MYKAGFICTDLDRQEDWPKGSVEKSMYIHVKERHSYLRDTMQQIVQLLPCTRYNI